MKKTTPFDWATLRAYIEFLKAPPMGRTIPTDQTEHFGRFRQFTSDWTRVSDPRAAESAMIDLAEDFKLDWRRAARLYIQLQRLVPSHILGRELDAFAHAGDPIKKLEKIRVSLAKLERFSKSLLAEDAGRSQTTVEEKLESAAHGWADELRLESEKPGQYQRWEEAKAHGFQHVKVPVGTRDLEPDPPIHISYDHSYDAHVVVRTWLRNNILFSRLVAKIIQKERPSKVADATETDHLSSAQRLPGVDLPKLYEQCTGKPFRFSTMTDGTTLADTGGPRFACMCYPVMGLPKPSLYTLRTHWQSPEARMARGA